MKQKSQLRQPTPQDLIDDLLGFLQRKFYPNHALAFTKDRPRLLKWVVLWPAAWLNKRAVTLPADRYREIFMAVFMDGLRFGKIEKVTYLPAYLARIIQSHFDHHGDEIYAEAKSMRNLVDHAIVVAGRAQSPAADPVRELAAAASLLKFKKKAAKTSAKSQLDLL